MDPSEPTNPPEENVDNNQDQNLDEYQNAESQTTENVENTVETETAESIETSDVAHGESEGPADESDTIVSEPTPEQVVSEPAAEAGIDPEPPTAAYNPFAGGNAPVDPDAQTSVATSGLAVPPPKKAGKKKWLAPVIALVIAVIVLGGAASAYAFWYQNPNRVVSDAVTNLLSGQTPNAVKLVLTSDSELAPGTPLNVKIKNLTIDGKASKDSNVGADSSLTIAVNGRDYKIGAKVVTTKSGDFYFQINDVKELIQKVLDDFAGSDSVTGLSSAFSDSLDKLQNRWVKVSADKDTSDKDSTQCVLDVFNKYATKDNAHVLTDAYNKHPFIKAQDQVAGRDGDLGYKVTIDRDQSKQFGQELKDSDFVKELDKCDTSSSSSDDASASKTADDTSGSATLYISRFSHRLSSLDFSVTTPLSETDSNKATFNGRVDLGYDQDNKVTVPTDSESFDEWQQDLVTLYMQYLFGSAELDSSTTTTGLGDTSSFNFSL